MSTDYRGTALPIFERRVNFTTSTKRGNFELFRMWSFLKGYSPTVNSEWHQQEKRTLNEIYAKK